MGKIDDIPLSFQRFLVYLEFKIGTTVHFPMALDFQYFFKHLEFRKFLVGLRLTMEFVFYVSS